MNFTVIPNQVNGTVRACTDALATEFKRRGAHETTSDDEHLSFVLNLSTVDEPRVFRRRHKSVFVVSVIQHPAGDEETIKAAAYRALVRTFSNLLICLVPNGDGRPKAHFVTPEVGYYALPFEAGAVCDRIAPIVGSRFATDNRLDRDLPGRLWDGSPAVEELKRGGAELDRLGAMPAPFPLDTLLSPDDLTHLYRVFGITGASYGNLSVRERVPELGDDTFWMTGRGVDKRNLRTVGEDVLLVREFIEGTSTAVLSVPPHTSDRARVSVDAVEHYLIYRAFPEVGAIVHVHAWIDGVLCTRQNYPCGTWELAREVVDLLKTAPDPTRCALGLKNHGLTITGHNLEELFGRVRDHLRVTVPMFA